MCNYCHTHAEARRQRNLEDAKAHVRAFEAGILTPATEERRTQDLLAARITLLRIEEDLARVKEFLAKL